MMDNVIEYAMALFECFYSNLTGLCIVIITLIAALILCRFTNAKIVILCIGACYFVLLFGILATVVGNTPDTLWIILLFMPICSVLTIECGAYYLSGLIIIILKRISDRIKKIVGD